MNNDLTAGQIALREKFKEEQRQSRLSAWLGLISIGVLVFLAWGVYNYIVPFINSFH